MRFRLAYLFINDKSADWPFLRYSSAGFHKQAIMKALIILTVPAVLAGCSSLAQTLKALQISHPEPKNSKDVEIASIDKGNSYKYPTLAHRNPLPSPLTNAPAKSASAPITASETAPFSPPPKSFKIGSRGEAVLALQKRLAELRYDVGTVDGFYDQQTWQGVVAFQKYAKLKRTGAYTPETQEALSEATLPEGSYPELGLPRIEIDLQRQILLYFDEQGLNRVIAVSTGSNRKYCETSKKSGEQVCGAAHTPRGKFQIQRKIPGWRESDLGKLYNPLYFLGGFAIHGSPFVPVYNVSHGCVRLSIATSLWFYSAIKIGTPVVVYD